MKYTLFAGTSISSMISLPAMLVTQPDLASKQILYQTYPRGVPDPFHSHGANEACDICNRNFANLADAGGVAFVANISQSH